MDVRTRVSEARALQLIFAGGCDADVRRRSAARPEVPALVRRMRYHARRSIRCDATIGRTTILCRGLGGAAVRGGLLVELFGQS
jgi:hypothetical protein